MNKTVIFALFSYVIALAFAGCGEQKPASEAANADSVFAAMPDSAIYGTVNAATTMHTLVITTDEGKSVEFFMDGDSLSDIQGGLFGGNRITLITTQTENGVAVQKALNLTTLLGKWTSLDRNFEIKEDGIVESSVQAESNPYTHWSTANADLILNTDTFKVLLLDADSLTLENAKGIFVYKRQLRFPDVRQTN